MSLKFSGLCVLNKIFSKAWIDTPPNFDLFFWPSFKVKKLKNFSKMRKNIIYYFFYML